jgi:RNA polymerase sigma factor (TIGR02999 family)
MTNGPRSEITRLLLDFQAEGQVDAIASDRLLDLVYAELRRTASALMARERVNHTLQPTALVHEAYMRLVHQDQVAWTDRAHFLGIAARSMRQILVDHARVKNAEKRGGDRHQVTLDEALVSDGAADFELLMLNDALDKLAKLDERASQVAEMRLFGGMNVGEIVHALDISKRSVDGDWATARLWLSRELSED